MLRATALVTALLAVLLAGCGSGPVTAPADDASTGTSRGPAGTAAPEAGPTSAPEDEDPSFGEPHPVFAAHFTDPLYTDEGGEFAPFGTDEGWDVMVSWAEGRDELSSCTTVRDLLADEQVGGGTLDDPEQNGPDVDATIIAAGFGLLYLTGQVDREGKQLTLDALRRTASSYPGVRELATMTRDLTSFRVGDACPR